MAGKTDKKDAEKKSATKVADTKPAEQELPPERTKSTTSKASKLSKLPDAENKTAGTEEPPADHKSASTLGTSKLEVGSVLAPAEGEKSAEAIPVVEEEEEVLSLKIGIIGGTGLDDPDIMENRVVKPCENQFGEVSGGSIIEGDIRGVPCVLISRHGPQHNINPTNVNYRANIWALKQAKCTHVLATTATGSLVEDIKPGDFVILDDFIDRTQHRMETFYDGTDTGLEGVFHLPVHPPFSPPVRAAILDAAADIGLEAHDGGTVVTIEGPRFSSRAESRMYQQWGGSVVNMSTVPEVVLAKEAGLMYAAIAMATDYDCWKDGEISVTHEQVLETFEANVENLQELLVACVVKIKELDWMKDYMVIQKLIKDSMMK